MIRNLSTREIYYHGCGKLKYDFMVRHGALPAFTSDGDLYVSAHEGTAFEYALPNNFLDNIVIRLHDELKISEILEMEPTDSVIQLRSIVSSAIRKYGRNIGKISSTLAGYFPISSKEFRKVLESQEKFRYSLGGFIIALVLDGESLEPNTFPDEATDYGMKIPLTGANKSRSSVSIELTYFVRYAADLYKKSIKEIPALNLENRFINVESV